MPDGALSNHAIRPERSSRLLAPLHLFGGLKHF
jgi:hypothetical protein